MKKQINPTIKAHLIRGAFYLLLLLAVCAIPFALGQRATKRNVAKQTVAAQQGATAHAQKFVPASTGAVPGTLPAKPASPSIPKIDQSQLPTFPASSRRLPGSAVAGKPA